MKSELPDTQLTIKVRNLEGLACTVEAVVKEYHALEANEHRTSRLLIRTQGELREALRAMDDLNRARVRDAERNPLELLGPERVILSIEEHGRLKAQSACLLDLICSCGDFRKRT